MAIRLLVAEDEVVSRRLIVAALTEAGFDVVAAENGREAWEIVQREDIRLVVADWMMPEMDGLELVRNIRARTDQPYVYTLLLTSRSEKQDIVSGLSSGADDYVTKPFDRDELFARIRAGERIIRLEQELELKNRQLADMAMVDGLTGVGNRRSFDENLHRIWTLSKRFARTFSVVMLDIDFFKRFNDSMGHEAGDEVLRRVAVAIQTSLRASDSVYRYGGEEFICLLPETDAAGVYVVAERVRQAIEALAIAHHASPFGTITASVGVASSDRSGSPTCDLVRVADQNLYCSKHNGRNRVTAPGVVESPA
jgi:two-component system chemotaxis response regulator CheY